MVGTRPPGVGRVAKLLCERLAAVTRRNSRCSTMVVPRPASIRASRPPHERRRSVAVGPGRLPDTGEIADGRGRLANPPIRRRRSIERNEHPLGPHRANLQLRVRTMMIVGGPRPCDGHDRGAQNVSGGGQCRSRPALGPRRGDHPRGWLMVCGAHPTMNLRHVGAGQITASGGKRGRHVEVPSILQDSGRQTHRRAKAATRAERRAAEALAGVCNTAPTFSAGICLISCQPATDDCPSGSICVGLQQDVCANTCTEDADCRPEFTCQPLLGPNRPMVCFPPLP